MTLSLCSYLFEKNTRCKEIKLQKTRQQSNYLQIKEQSSS